MAGVYLSFPFCAQKCTFCNFASGVFPRSLEQRYLETLRAEIAGFAWTWTPETVYIGGGTPSRMPVEVLADLLALIPGRPWREATIEAAPGTVTPEKAGAWRSAGLDRVSLGVQSFVEHELTRTGRRHTTATVEQEVRTLREAGISNFNIDLIAGLPCQTQASWEESLDRVERLGAPHVSVYMLEVDEDSRLGAEILHGGRRYSAPEAPSEETVVALYERAVDRLDAAGIRQYEISNFARAGAESLHNLKYWRMEPYSGFGADAHSFDGAVRRQNPESPEEYVERAPAIETPSAPDERFLTGLRLREGMRPTAAEWEQHSATIRRFIDLGLLETDGSAVRLTRRGILLSNEVFQEFLT